jgi:phospholipase/carboxylesterase
MIETPPPLTALISEGDADAPVIVLLHGRGSDERDLFALGRELHPRATVVSVRAPFPAAPWGYGPGWAWYRFMGGTTPEPESFERGQVALAGFLDGLPARLGRPIPAPSLILGGFSQGGTSALAFALRHPGRVGAVLVFSGFLASHPSVAVPQGLSTPIWWGHGTADGAIPYANGEAGWQALLAAGAALTTASYPGMGHTISAEELSDAATWVQRTVPS